MNLIYLPNPPKEAGWYWVKNWFADHPTLELIVHVIPRPGHDYLCVQFDSDGPRDFRSVKRMPNVQWAGPIPRPI